MEAVVIGYLIAPAVLGSIFFGACWIADIVSEWRARKSR